MKYFAMLTMFLNHIANFWELSGILGNFMLGIGYFTGPCMCYFLVEGFYHTRSVSAYMRRLILVGLLSQLPFNMLTQGAWMKFHHANMMFTLAMCLLVCIIYESYRVPQGLKLPIYIAIIILCTFSDWSYLAPVFVIVILRMRDGSISRRRGHCLQWLTYLSAMVFNAYDAAGDNYMYAVIYGLLYMTGPCLVTYCLIHRDESKPVVKSLWSKWFFYLFYPGHMLVLILMKVWLTGSCG